MYSPNVTTTDSTNNYLLIPSHANFDDLVSILALGHYLKKTEGFIWLAEKKNFKDKVKGGRYHLKPNMSNNQLINLLRSGRQTPVKVTFNNIRTKQQLAGQIAARIEADSTKFISYLNDDAFLNQFDLNTETALVLFIPNTYELWWTSSSESFMKRMHNEYTKFWNQKRLDKAKTIGLTPVEVSILASIVDEETIKTDEKPVVAGLYLNRLKKGIPLQADPTVKYALGDFTIQRILKKDLEINSPYNTYKNRGLPPGPIRIPSVAGIDAVLNRKAHDYYYMCAKEDFSGYHNFAVNLNQHNQNAAKYRRALQARKIYR